MNKDNSKERSRKVISDFKLNTLLEITNAINNNLTDSELFILFEDILKQKLYIGKAVFYFFQDDAWLDVMRYGISKEDALSEMFQELKQVKDITVLDTTGLDSKKSFDVVLPVFHHGETLAFVLLGDLDENARKPSPIIKHLSFIQTLANIISVAVKNRQLERENQRRQRIFQELRMASRMQEMLLPKTLPNNDVLQMSAVYRPHLAVGGDFYDLIEINENETVMCIADVSGKGLSAAILMANFQANLRANLKVEDDLVMVMHNLNKLVWDYADGERYITCFLAKYYHKERKVVYVNAAHPSALLVKGSHVIELASCTVGIGMFEEFPFISSCEHKVSAGCLMLFYTDGITETTNDKGEQFQEHELKRTAASLHNEDPSKVLKVMMHAVNDFKGTNHFNDDVALVSCRFV